MKNKYEYVTEEYVEKTKYKSIKDAYQRDYFSVVKYRNEIWIESRNCPISIYKRIIKDLVNIYGENYFIIHYD